MDNQIIFQDNDGNVLLTIDTEDLFIYPNVGETLDITLLDNENIHAVVKLISHEIDLRLRSRNMIVVLDL